MAWLVLGILVWAVFMVLSAPLIRTARNGAQNPDSAKDPISAKDNAEIQTYLSEIKRLEAELAAAPDPERAARKLELERQVLKLAAARSGGRAPSRLIAGSLFAVFVVGAVSLYAMLGRPDLMHAEALKTPPDTQTQTEPSLEDLAAQLKTKLGGAKKDDPTGWILYARTLMSLERYDEAFAAYERTAVLTNSDPGVIAEMANARDFAVSGPKGPSAADIEAAAAMSPEERAAMIEAMVDGLAARLRDSPQNPQGWVRLLQARKQLGQTGKAAEDIKILRKTYAAEPEIAAQIIQQSGWSSK